MRRFFISAVFGTLFAAAVFGWFRSRSSSLLPPLLGGPVEGLYEAPPFSRELDIELKGGRFRCFRRPISPENPPPYSYSGHYMISDDRISLTFEDAEDWGSYPKNEVLYYRRIGDISVVLDGEALGELTSGNKVNARSGVYVHSSRAKGEDPVVWWIGLLRNEPRFAAAIGTPYDPADYPWWKHARMKARSALHHNWGQLKGLLPNCFK